MRRFAFVLMGTMLAVSLAVAQSPRGATPVTPWGDPDLQGTWSSEAELSVPFERAAQYGDRRFLTDAEFEQRQKQTVTQLQSDLSEFEVFTVRRLTPSARSPVSSVNLADVPRLLTS